VTARVLICCGSGGVGKTTISAALALRIALDGARVVVLTIDPARRLADSLGLQLDNTARPIDISELSPAPGGALDALMLDARTTFDGLITRYAPGPAAAEAVLGNRYYRFASSKLGGAHEYMAQERLLQLAQEGDYDVVVVDTPPTRQALDFLRASERMSGLMDQGVLRWLVMPASRGGWRALELGSEALARVLRRLLGRGTIGEIAAFFEAFRELSEGFRQRSQRVAELLGAPQTRFLLVTSTAAASRREALAFRDLLAERGLPFGGFVVNRVMPAPAHPFEAAALPAEGPLSSERWAEMMAAVRESHASQARISAQHAEAVSALGTPAWAVPDCGVDLHSLQDLATLGPALAALADQPATS